MDDIKCFRILKDPYHVWQSYIISKSLQDKYHKENFKSTIVYPFAKQSHRNRWRYPGVIL